MLSYEFYEIFKNTYFIEHVQVTASVGFVWLHGKFSSNCLKYTVHYSRLWS